MNKFITAALAASVAASALATAAFAEGKVIGVSWSNFQEERWKTDEAAMKAAISCLHRNSFPTLKASSHRAQTRLSYWPLTPAPSVLLLIQPPPKAFPCWAMTALSKIRVHSI